jgi:hypothetical protein
VSESLERQTKRLDLVLKVEARKLSYGRTRDESSSRWGQGIVQVPAWSGSKRQTSSSNSREWKKKQEERRFGMGETAAGGEREAVVSSPRGTSGW